MAVPRVLYLVPNGQNPVSYVAPLERKRALYRVCQEHDLMIVEDDPYFYLQFPFDGTPLLQGALGTGIAPQPYAIWWLCNNFVASGL